MKTIKFIGSQAKLLVAVAISAVVGGAATAVVSASIPDSSGTIHGCYNTKTGNLSVIDSGAGKTCTAKQTALNWSANGGGGSSGPAGIAYVDFNFNGGQSVLDSARSSGVSSFGDAGNGLACITFVKTPSFFVSSGIGSPSPAKAAIKTANGWTDDTTSYPFGGGGPSSEDTTCDTSAPGSNAYIVPSGTSSGIGYMAIF